MAMTVVVAEGLSVLTMTVIVLLAVLTFFLLALATKIATGREFLVYYHHVIAIGLTTAAFLTISGKPIVAYLDPTVLGLGSFLVFGRIGCFMVGCCHGRPSRHGVRYGPTHAALGFPAGLIGVPLVPVQLFESAWTAAAAAVGLVEATGGTAGDAFLGYMTTYAFGRFWLEFLRGDDRPHAAAVSHAQWISGMVVWAVAGAGVVGWLPARPYCTVVGIALSIALWATVVRLPSRRSISTMGTGCH